MAVNRTDIVDIDLSSGTVRRSFINHQLGEGDAKGDRFGVRVLRDGQEQDLTGVSITAFFIRDNGTTVAISSSCVGRDGSVCYVELPAGCYQVEGGFRLSIKLTASGKTVTARIVEGTIVNTTLGTIVDTGTAIPDLSAYTEFAEAIEAAAAKIESFNITETLISGTRYKIGVVDAT